ncbi:bacilysin biosynthesis protein BacC [Niastella yeongjuensis]|uniref:Bacilysin biosynthesis protein BacC n=1 Tax=Niastella yeongjuensis TaxID=354355 RepID=A0A1V9EH77_9BACT|nr:SDR family oxidoreductase [Niastella yeongjuensis]OQP45255.1 bacilysin biosynthesis protein BacC [Niastella yeongjuensis]SEO28191.1 NAD(P)-dependent dehydrogenase, short-chain alcohol dehydrogenase family [Niastella yeongjuensis]
MEWKDTVTVITGASSGIGKATLELLRNEGSLVYNLDNMPSAQADPYFIDCDVRNRLNVEQAIKTIYDKEKRINFLFSNAGRHLFANIEDTSYEQLESLVGINLMGTFYLLKTVIPLMKLQQKGSIVLMGSDQSFVGKANSSVYGMTKGAIAQLAKSTAIDYAPFNIRVNCICPGTIQTPLLDNAVKQFVTLSGQETTAVYASLDSVQPLGRIGRPDEIARTVRFLLSDDSSFITGALIAVDGGYTCQ